MFRLILRLLYSIIVLIEALLGIRFILKFINANKDNQLVSYVYEYSEPFVRPFVGITSTTINLFGISLDLNTLVALGAFMILGYVVLELSKAFSRD